MVPTVGWTAIAMMTARASITPNAAGALVGGKKSSIRSWPRISQPCQTTVSPNQ
jgi:hypothetical protein